ncbi:MAG TPA: hypothetical protein ENG09_03355 [Candidatus Syntrophoarchaeum butanivorans]|uniref:Uncharacterized protein n=1 Tax=Candidatus Syntropharchaeum butanivorans TaxID=1839936 RepID=A0A7C1B725_9EURY|nr:hypothetical protein [Candidatus Syntrophoarchaeum butanivorans]
MTKVVIHGGACKFKTEVTVLREGESLRIETVSECEYCRSLGDDLVRVSFSDLFPDTASPALGFMDNPVYRKADEHLPHVDCPVPCGILKAILAELGLQLKEPPKIEFTE